MKLINTSYSHLRGFNYVPSYAFILYDIMEYFDEQVWDREFGYAQDLCANSLRVWFSSVSFHKNPDRFLKNFEKILDLAGKHQLTIMPTLYNRWVDANYPFGQLELAHMYASNDVHSEHIQYVTQFVSAFRDDPRVIMWDMCNEPYGYWYFTDANLVRELRKHETIFLKRIFDCARSAKPVQPLTIGLTEPFSCNDIAILDDSDVISFHQYSGWWDDGFAKMTDAAIDLANARNKSLICSETCQGSLDDQVRNECIRNSIGTLRQKEIGWYAWQLCAGQMVSARRDRTDNNAKPGDRGYMCFMLEDGSVRPGHEIIRQLNRS